MATIALDGPTDTASLQAEVRRSERRRRLTTLLLMAPSVLFVAALFATPIGLFLLRAVTNDGIPDRLPGTTQAVQQWDGRGTPAAEAYVVLANELLALKGSPELAQLGRRLNFVLPGYRSLVMKTGRALDADDIASRDAEGVKQRLIEVDERWADPAFWAPLKQQSGRFTTFYVETALDLQRSVEGDLEAVPSDRAIFIDLYMRTLRISLGTTVLCLLIGFPVAAVMARATGSLANLMLTLVLIPFWTSLLVRTTAWVILLQNEGLVNKSLIWLGLIDQPLQLVFSRFGVYVAMVHVLLPYMILPLYSVMKGISPHHLRAASSLGAGPLTVFRTVYLPLVMPGIVAGATLVFVLAIGFYVTPALVGGAGDQMIGYFIAYFTNSAVNWGLASALGAILLVMVVIIYAVLGWAVGLDRLKVR